MAFGLRQRPGNTNLHFYPPAVEKRDLPKALWLLVASIVIACLSSVPGLGPMLVFLLIPFLPILLVNSCMIGIVGEVFTGQVAMGWLVVPLLYVMAYLSLVTISQVDLARLESAIRQHNANQLIGFAATDALVVRNGVSDGTVRRLLEDYDLPIIYEESPHPRERRVTSRRLAVGADCQPKPRKAYRADDPVISGIYEQGTARPGRPPRSDRVEDMCTIEQPSQIPTNAVRVEIKAGEWDESNYFLYTKQRSIKITGKDGKTANLIFAETYPLSWVPMPFYMCARAPGGDKETCFGGFLRFIATMVGGEGDTPAGLIATSLGIKKASASSRKDAIMAMRQAAPAQP
ncbi:hypothetical protein [Rhizobium sp. AAP43]|uniref:hypothetical protein n=1 Tax=Rhizobium sp. AAP43 TaxID=1523420 RepID=UPI0006B95481|nr:hypothetical protein [Rhizobium sp. AAP43]KPF46865.1 hypothetical protein IP76_03060 [Rhizobium sp. AAP43]